MSGKIQGTREIPNISRWKRFRTSVCLLLLHAYQPLLAVSPITGVQDAFSVPHLSAQLIVRTADTATIDGALLELNTLGGTLLGSHTPGNVHLVEIRADGDLRTAASLLDARTDVLWVEPNYLYLPTATPNDVRFAEQWSKENTAVNVPGGAGHIGADIDALAAWDVATDALSASIAIIDDSLDIDHSDLVLNATGVHGCFASPRSNRPCTNGPLDPRPSDNADFHGTLVAGVAAAQGDNGMGVAGVAWRAVVHGFKTDLSAFAIAQAIDTAVASNVAVINMSFGGPVESRTISDALERAEQLGIIAVASAGNADGANERSPVFPANTDLPNLLSVAATTGADRIASFSQWSSSRVDVAAPGSDILTTGANNSYVRASGTSFAAPHVAGLAALTKSALALDGYEDTIARILAGARPGRSLLGEEQPGSDVEGIPGRTATGRIDAAATLGTPLGLAVMVDAVTIDDSLFGNNNGVLEPGERANLQVGMRNAGANDVFQFELSTTDGPLIVETSTTSALSIARQATATASFAVRLPESTSGHQIALLTLAIDSSSSSVARQLYLEFGSLEAGATLTQSIQRWDWDEFQGFTLVVPEDTTQMTVRVEGAGDIDLLMKRESYPEHLITLNAERTASAGFYYVSPNTLVSASAAGVESISLSDPTPGTYYLVVVNYDQQPKTYSLETRFDSATAEGIRFGRSNLALTEGDAPITLAVERLGTQGSVQASMRLPEQLAAQLDVTNGVLSWQDGESGVQLVTVEAINDNTNEATIIGELTLDSSTVILAPAALTVTLSDDDAASTTSTNDTASSGGGSISWWWLLLLLCLSARTRY